MLEMRVFGILQIMEYGPGRDDAFLHLFDAEAFEGMGLEMPQQAFSCIGLLEDPALQGITIVFRSEDFFKMSLEISLEDNFGGAERLQQFVDVFGIALCDKELPGGD